MGRFDELPEPVRLEDTITSEEVDRVEPSTERAVDEWLLRNAAG